MVSWHTSLLFKAWTKQCQKFLPACGRHRL
jgi:hypothetical protein